MKLYTRLISEGIFIFWSSEKMDSTFNLKIKTVEGNEKITLLDITPEKGKNCYSFNDIGSGDYEIELNGYQNNRLYQTATQKMKFNSSREYVSTMAMGLASMAKAVGAIYTTTKQISDKAAEISDYAFRIEMNTEKN